MFLSSIRSTATRRLIASRAASSQAAAAYVSQPKNILLLGAGRVSYSLVDLLGRKEKNYNIVVASDSLQEAQKVATIANHGTAVVVDVSAATKNKDSKTNPLKKLIQDSDIVISFLPATMHPSIANLCIDNQTNLVTASYESDEMRSMVDRIQASGIVILNEVGLDPGLDHMSAMKIIDDIHARGGSVSSFSSVCGGLPSPAAAVADNNPLKYKFSWSPKGVLTASQNSAQYRWDKEIIQIPGNELLNNSKPYLDAFTDLNLEVLPNRNSLQYGPIYNIESADTLFRGTLRYGGFSSLMYIYKQIGLFESVPPNGSTWDGVINNLIQQSGESTLEDLMRSKVKSTDNIQRAIDALKWLGMVTDDNTSSRISNKDSVVDSFCNVLENKLKFKDTETDLVVMNHMIQATLPGDKKEIHSSSLYLEGDRNMSAMCKTVGYTAAAATEIILNNYKDANSGQGKLLLPIQEDIYNPILEAVEKEGIIFEESCEVHHEQRLA